MRNSNTTKNKTVEAPQKKGYKHTSLGWIPKDWEEKKFGEIVLKSQYGLSNPSESDGTYRIIGMKNIQDGRLILDSCATVNLSNEEYEKYKLNKDDFLFNRTNSIDLVGKSILIEKDINATFASYLIRFKLNYGLVVPKFIYYYFNTQFSENRLKKIATKAVSQANINPTALQKIFTISLPPLSEQRRIAALLSTWDDAITKTQQLIEQLEQRNKGLMQQLLTGKKRLKGFSGEWKEYRLDNFFKERNETRNIELPLLSIGQNGVYPQSVSNKKDISNTDKSKYKRICSGDIGYNTMRMWQGRSALSYMEGIVSPAYTIVIPKKNADPLFFSYLFKTLKLMNLFWRNSQGLVDDTLNCRFKDFIIVKVPLPERKEQTAIVSILKKSMEEVNLYEQKLAALKEQRRGLMQVLLTGKKRLEVHN